MMEMTTIIGSTTQQHFLKEVVNFDHAEQFDELNLFNHLPGNALQCWQQQQQLSKPATRVILPVIDVVLQADLHLEPHVLNLHRVTQSLCIWVKKTQWPSSTRTRCHLSGSLGRV